MKLILQRAFWVRTPLSCKWQKPDFSLITAIKRWGRGPNYGLWAYYTAYQYKFMLILLDGQRTKIVSTGLNVLWKALNLKGAGERKNALAHNTGNNKHGTKLHLTGSRGWKDTTVALAPSNLPLLSVPLFVGLLTPTAYVCLLCYGEEGHRYISLFLD